MLTDCIISILKISSFLIALYSMAFFSMLAIQLGVLIVASYQEYAGIKKYSNAYLQIICNSKDGKKETIVMAPVVCIYSHFVSKSVISYMKRAKIKSFEFIDNMSLVPKLLYSLGFVTTPKRMFENYILLYIFGVVFLLFWPISVTLMCLNHAYCYNKQQL